MNSLKEFKDSIQSHFEQQLPFVVYNEPESNELIALLQPSTSLHSAKGFKRSGFVFCPFQSGKATVLIPDAVAQELVCQVDEHFFDEQQVDEVIPTSPPIESGYERMVIKAIQKIESGAAKKIVLSRKIEIPVDDTNGLDIVFDTIKAYRDAFTYGFFHPKLGFWIGATPETLIDVTGTTFKTMALAGTQKVREGMNPSWTQKEINEQYFVTQAITEGLQPLVKVIVVSKTKNKQAGNLWHICNDISGTLKNKKELLERVINALHPTPAICGMPEDISKRFILKNEGYDREFYSGYLGRLSPELNARFFVNLRCLKLVDNIANVFVGGGITEDSAPLEEWVETAHKSLTMKRLLLPYSKLQQA
ncbi:MAG: chorismate-binding protein [Gilvibacter sp.]